MPAARRLPRPVPAQRAPSIAPLSVALALHLALGVWALGAWIGGPFGGAAVVDAAEVLALSVGGTTGAFETKSPLYPALLAAVAAVFGAGPWVIGALGLVLSSACLCVVYLLARDLGGPRAGSFAAFGFALSGSVYAFAVQPLPAVLAALALTASCALLGRATRAERPIALAALGGAALGAAVFTRAPLALAAVLLLGWLALRRRASVLWPCSLGVGAVTLCCVLGFGARAWPEGGALAFRNGNGPDVTGTSELRPGPAYDRLRYESVFAQPDDRPLGPTGRFHVDAALRACAAEPLGALATLWRKAFLFVHRTETHTGADFRHGLRDWPLAPILLWSFGLIAPLALLGLLRGPRPGVVWLPIAAVFVANVVFVTSARYRFPALPLCCVAAALAVCALRDAHGRRRIRAWSLAALLAVAGNVNCTGRSLTWPGDGLVQEGYLRMSDALQRESPATREVLERALEASGDARAAYLLGLWHTDHLEQGRAEGHFERAVRAYDRALELDARYTQAAENRIQLWAAVDPERARALARDAVRDDPYAGLARLNLAELERARPGADPDAVRTLEAEGHRIMALRQLAQNARERAAFHAVRARALGVVDRRLDGLPAGARGPPR